MKFKCQKCKIIYDTEYHDIEQEKNGLCSKCEKIRLKKKNNGDKNG